jgi:hypothetical protein
LVQAIGKSGFEERIEELKRERWKARRRELWGRKAAACEDHATALRLPYRNLPHRGVMCRHGNFADGGPADSLYSAFGVLPCSFSAS